MTITCMELPSLAQQINSDQERIKLHPLLIPTKYCFLILGEDTRFIFFLYFSFLFYVFISIFVIYKVFLLPYFNVFIIFFYNFLNFFMFRDVPECSGMFRSVSCSWFYRRPCFSLSYCETHKTMNTRNINGMSLCYEKLTNKARDN